MPSRDTNKPAASGCEPSWLSVPAVAELLTGKRIARPDQCGDKDLDGLGLLGDEQRIWLPDALETIDLPRLREKMASRARRLCPAVEIAPAMASTNSELMMLGTDAPGRLLITEYQYSGRGRRGREWLSPIGQNLCFSLGLKIPGSINGLGGLSLVVGLAVADALITEQVPGVLLKWPNDLIVLGTGGAYAKLGGILVELQAHDGFCVAVIGIGINHGGATAARSRLSDTVQVADVAQLQPGIDRTDTLAVVVNSLSDYLENFLQLGFAPMKSAWESLHAFHDRDVTVTFSEHQQKTSKSGRVAGVTDSGHLVVVGAGGERMELDSGEVSLRPLDPKHLGGADSESDHV